MSDLPEFGIKRENEIRRDGGCAVIFDPKTKLFAVGEREGGGLLLFSGGVNKDEDMKDGVTREVMEESGLYDFSHVEKISEVMCHYYNSLKKMNVFAHAICFLFILKSTDLIPTKLEAHENFRLTWKTKEEILSNWESRNKEKDLDHWFYVFDKATTRLKELGYERN